MGNGRTLSRGMSQHPISNRRICAFGPRRIGPNILIDSSDLDLRKMYIPTKKTNLTFEFPCIRPRNIKWNFNASSWKRHIHANLSIPPFHALSPSFRRQHPNGFPNSHKPRSSLFRTSRRNCLFPRINSNLDPRR